MIDNCTSTCMMTIVYQTVEYYHYSCGFYILFIIWDTYALMYKLENYFYTDKSKFGYKMLQKMGWSEGKGLGVSEDGALEHIKVKMKCDTSGNITLMHTQYLSVQNPECVVLTYK